MPSHVTSASAGTFCRSAEIGSPDCASTSGPTDGRIRRRSARRTARPTAAPRSSRSPSPSPSRSDYAHPLPDAHVVPVIRAPRQVGRSRADAFPQRQRVGIGLDEQVEVSVVVHVPPLRARRRDASGKRITHGRAAGIDDRKRSRVARPRLRAWLDRRARRTSSARVTARRIGTRTSTPAQRMRRSTPPSTGTKS